MPSPHLSDLTRIRHKGEIGAQPVPVCTLLRIVFTIG
jgi:hypothetical protein